MFRKEISFACTLLWSHPLPYSSSPGVFLLQSLPRCSYPWKQGCAKSSPCAAGSCVTSSEEGCECMESLRASFWPWNHCVGGNQCCVTWRHVHTHTHTHTHKACTHTHTHTHTHPFPKTDTDSQGKYNLNQCFQTVINEPILKCPWRHFLP